jgi:cytochrome oxidase Cu insertion factor (SCO1/SenC/PrrC family)
MRRSIPWILALFLALAALPAGAEEGNAERVEVGQEAPAIQLSGSDGETYDSNALRGEKDLVLIFFRGTW